MSSVGHWRRGGGASRGDRGGEASEAAHTEVTETVKALVTALSA